MKCTIINCDKEIICKSMCSKHYYRVRRGGTPLLSKKQQMALRVCDVKNCGKKHDSHGLCSTHLMKKRRSESPELRAKDYERLKIWRVKNKESHAKNQSKYRQKHQKALAEYYRKWKSDNWPSLKAYIASRKRRVKKATPKWSNIEKIRAFYKNCPKGHHVDHIIPLNGINISGLHVMENLQYLPAIENLKKSNKF